MELEKHLLCERLDKISQLLLIYEKISNSYMVDFFSQDLHSTLPPSWQETFRSADIEELGDFLKIWSDVKVHRIWPLTLLALRTVLATLVIPTRMNNICFKTPCHLSPRKKPEKLPHFTHPRLKNLFLKHVKPKKRAEIERMAHETALLAMQTGAGTVIDIGSGLGHLCRTLGYGYGLRVLGIEAQEELTERAEYLDQELEITASKHLSTETLQELRTFRPKHKRMFITFDTKSEHLLKMISEIEGRSFGIVGLHPCGNLAAILLKLFVSSPEIRFINIVGCCYHKMTMSASPHIGFPLSKHLLKKRTRISSEAASLACHAIENYSKRLSTGDYQHLKIHCFRATLERIIVKNWPEHARAGLNNVKQYPNLSFPEYCEKALKRLGLTVPNSDLESEQTRKDLSRWKSAVIYHSLMLMFGPVVESIVLLDRVLYLVENGITCQLQAVFDPLISPRNHILAAVKTARRDE